MELKGVFVAVKKTPGSKDPGSFWLKTDDGSNVLCDGVGWNMKKGTPLFLEGEWSERSKSTFILTSIRLDELNEERCVRFFAKSGFRRVGEATAKKMYLALREEAKDGYFSELPTSKIWDILELLKLSDSKIQISTAIQVIPTHLQIMRDFQAYHITPKEVEILYDAYGAAAYEELKKDPYSALSLGLSFQVCDQIAWDYGNALSWNKPRVAAAVKQMARKATNVGSCCIRMKPSVDYLRFLLNSGRYDKLPDELIYTEVVSSSNLIIKHTNDYGVIVYPKFYFYVERDIITEIKRLINSSKPISYDGYHGQSSLDPDQLSAMEFLNSGGIKILHGGPGSGKTTVIREFVEEFSRTNPSLSVYLCAPTGRAAVRMTESCGGKTKAITLHKLLGILPGDGVNKSRRDHDNQLSCGLFVLDEMSMVDEVLFLRFLQAIPNGSLVILSGDPEQLPSISAGTVLRDLINSNALPSVRLNGNHRQSGRSIVENYLRMREGNWRMIEDDAFHVIRVTNSEDALCELHRLYDAYYSDDPSEFQILTATKKGDLGKNRLDSIISEWKNRNGPINLYPPSGRFYEGDRIVMLRNNYTEGYWNGDIGRILSYSPLEGYKILFYDGVRTISSEGSKDMEEAFALTIHKAQGSEYDRVVVVLSDEYPNMLTRALFLTVMTRAKKEVFVISIRGAMAQAIQNNRDAARITGLSEFLRENIV